jgi:acyl-CoA synthetase (AMP-forming)/AMP-acid ligase II
MELTLQLQSSKSAAVFTSRQLLRNATEACRTAGIPERNVFIVETAVISSMAVDGQQTTIDYQCEFGQTLPQLESLSCEEQQEASRVAFLCYSSGTSGLPVRVILYLHRRLC